MFACFSATTTGMNNTNAFTSQFPPTKKAAMSKSSRLPFGEVSLNKNAVQPRYTELSSLTDARKNTDGSDKSSFHSFPIRNSNSVGCSQSYPCLSRFCENCVNVSIPTNQNKKRRLIIEDDRSNMSISVDYQLPQTQTTQSSDMIDESANQNIDCQSQSKSKDKIPNVTNEQLSEATTPPNGISSVTILPETPIDQRYTVEDIIRIIGEDDTEQIYYNEMYAEEKRNNAVMWFNDRASYLSVRVKAIDWLCMTGIEMGMSRSTIYHAIFYFDRLCSLNDVNRCHIQMASIVCLMVAAKWNEKEEKVPTLDDLCHRCGNVHSTNHFKTMEAKIMNLLNWELKCILPIHFCQYFVAKGVVFNDDTLDGHSNLDSHPHAPTYLKKFNIFFMDIISQDYNFWRYLPSIQASAVMVASRRALRIQPYWRDDLVPILRHSYHEFHACLKEIWEIFRLKFPNDVRRAEADELAFARKQQLKQSRERGDLMVMSGTKSPSVKENIQSQIVVASSPHLQMKSYSGVKLGTSMEQKDDSDDEMHNNNGSDAIMPSLHRYQNSNSHRMSL